MGKGNRIDAHVVISGTVNIGDNNWICSGVILGAIPEIRTLRPDPMTDSCKESKGLRIGSNNVIREGTQIHSGFKRTTILGDNVYVMNQVYLAHDCEIADGVTIAAGTLVAGDVKIGANANLGLGVKVHQGLEIGSIAMVGMGSVVTKGVPQYAKAYGVPAKIHGINSVGMARAGLDAKEIHRAVLKYESGD
jgi:UDP-N-acetylglucosamine acyltransferase